MTRFARGGDSNRKKKHEASGWSDLKRAGSAESSNSQLPQSKGHNSHNNKIDSNGVKQSTSDRTIKHSVGKNNSYGKQKQLKAAFMNSSNSKEKEVAEIFWKTERSNQRRLDRIQERQNQKVCYNCRQPGHQVAQCPEVKRDADQGTGICFKCGSTEHQSSQCTAKVKPGTYPFAKCFVCGEMGHITKQCPDNPRGLYPNGGSCNMCGSVEHFRKDCPRLFKQQGITEMTLDTISTVSSLDDDPALIKQKKKHSQGPLVKKPKVVKF